MKKDDIRDNLIKIREAFGELLTVNKNFYELYIMDNKILLAVQVGQLLLLVAILWLVI